MMVYTPIWEHVLPLMLAIAAAPLVLVVIPAYAVQRFLHHANAVPADAANELVVMEASINHLSTRVEAISETIAVHRGDE